MIHSILSIWTGHVQFDQKVVWNQNSLPFWFWLSLDLGCSVFRQSLYKKQSKLETRLRDFSVRIFDTSDHKGFGIWKTMTFPKPGWLGFEHSLYCNRKQKELSILAKYSKCLKSECSDFGVFRFGSFVKLFGFWKLTEISNVWFVNLTGIWFAFFTSLDRFLYIYT